jgi:hypothetical protein
MFDFEINHGHEKDLVLFTGQLEGNDSDYGDEIDSILKARDYHYNEIIFLFPEYLENDFLKFINIDDRMISNLNRAEGAKQISFVRFNGFSDLTVVHIIKSNVGSICDECEKLKAEIIQSGIFSLVEKRKDKVILKSPPGTVFKKPSQTKFSEFIKTSELSVGYSENQFLAFTLLASRPFIDDIRSIKNIWIDTSSISQYIEPLIYYIQRFNGDDQKNIKYHSFQSYGDDASAGYECCIPDVLDDVWVVISASSSNNLGRKIYQAWNGLEHEQIVTILSYADTQFDQDYLSNSQDDNPEYPLKFGDRIVANISKFSEIRQGEISYGSEVPINVIGENFTVQVEDPNQVLLRKPHAPIEISNFINPLNETNSILCSKKVSNRLRSTYFDYVEFSKTKTVLNDKYKRWLKDIVSWYMPSSIACVIYDFNDEASKVLFDDIKPYLGNIDIVDINDIKSIESDKGIVALMPVITRGHSFIKLNSDLRLLGHDGQRFFIAPFATPQTHRDFDLFHRSLILGPRNLKYNFFNFRKVYLGHQEAENSWQRELKLIERFNSDIWVERASRLRKQSEGIQQNIGVSCDPNNESLNFSVGFAFWTSGYNPEKVNSSAVYWTISAILQNLREKKFTDFDKETLFSHVYQHSVLDPLNFTRFNDPLLQSCLWRSAYDRELDFRTPIDMSRKFVDILERLAKSRAAGEFNATLDLLVGIAIGKIKISEQYLSEIIDKISKLLPNNPAFVEILEYIGHEFLRREATENTNQDVF